MDRKPVVRRRAEVLEWAIREAIYAELAEVGFQALGFEGVARRAKTSKPVLYRRYRSRAHMVIDSWLVLTPLALPQDSTGNLRADLIAIMSAVSERMHLIGIDTLRSVLAEADPELRESSAVQAELLAARRLSRAVNEARARGELGTAEIPTRIVILPMIMLRSEIFFSPERVGPHTVIEIVDEICLPLLRLTAETGDVSA